MRKEGIEGLELHEKRSYRAAKVGSGRGIVRARPARERRGEWKSRRAGRSTG